MLRYGMGSMRMPHPRTDGLPIRKLPSTIRISKQHRAAFQKTRLSEERIGSPVRLSRSVSLFVFGASGGGMRLTDTRQHSRGAPICVPPRYMQFLDSIDVCFLVMSKRTLNSHIHQFIYESTERKEPKGTLWQKQNRTSRRAS